MELFDGLDHYHIQLFRVVTIDICAPQSPTPFSAVRTNLDRTPETGEIGIQKKVRGNSNVMHFDYLVCARLQRSFIWHFRPTLNGHGSTFRFLQCLGCERSKQYSLNATRNRLAINFLAKLRMKRNRKHCSDCCMLVVLVPIAVFRFVSSLKRTRRILFLNDTNCGVMAQRFGFARLSGFAYVRMCDNVHSHRRCIAKHT